MQTARILQFLLVSALVLRTAQSDAQVYQDEITETFLASRTIDVNKPVGVIAGAPGVSSTGGATYTIPIYVPPGTNGVQPSVAVNYNSQGGDGIMGWGWSLSASSAIVRTGMDFYHDGKTKGITYGATDRFAVDGQRLVLTNAANYGVAGSTYDTENATFSEYTAHGSTNGLGPESFSVIARDGMKRFYGGTTDSRILADNGAVIIWLLSRVQDPFGNYMDYSYDPDQSECLLKEINYTGNGAVGIAPYNKIIFHYSARVDINETYCPRKAMKTSHLLQRIELVCESLMRKEYRFNYSQRDIHKSYLREVQEFAADGTTGLNSTVIKYRDANLAFSVEELTGLSGIGHDFYSGDFDGDGKMELLTSATSSDESGFPINHDLQVWGRDEANLYTLLWEMELPSAYSATVLNQPGSVFRTAHSTDMNGDGRDDIVLVHTGQLNSNFRGIGNIIILYAFEDVAGDLQFQQVLYNPPMIDGAPWGNIANSTRSFHALGDFNGDGKGDLLLFGKNALGTIAHAFLYSPLAGAEGTPVGFQGGYLEDILTAQALVSINYDGDPATELMVLPSSTSSYDGTLVYKTIRIPTGLSMWFTVNHIPILMMIIASVTSTRMAAPTFSVVPALEIHGS